jgi:hypothetical protein
MTHESQALRPPDESDPSLRFARYLVHPRTLAYMGIDHLSDRQLEAAENVPEWAVMTRDELLAEWRLRL